MIKAVNMKNYRFGKKGNIYYKGFGMLDTETNTFASFDGIHPYVISTKKLVQGCIEDNWAATLRKVACFSDK